MLVSHSDPAHTHEFAYDELVLAVGAVPNFYGIPGLEEHALTMKTLGDAMQLRNRLIDSLAKIESKILIWTAGTTPSEVLSSLPCKRERGRILANDSFCVEGSPGVWALGDCALIPDSHSPGHFHPPTAQHAIREAAVLARNIVADLRGRPLARFRFETIGLLAAIGRRCGVAQICGIKFSGFLAWWLWRSIYLSKLPGIEKRVRVMLAWTLDLIFSKDIVQFQTFRARTVSVDENAAISVSQKPNTHSIAA